MANIDSLNFEVILNDEKFNKKIEKDIENAKRLNTSLTQILNLKSKINTVSNGSYINEQKMAQAAAKTAEAKVKQALAEQKVRTEAEKTALAEQKVKAAIEGSVKSMGGGGSSLQRAWLRFSATIWSIVGAIRLFTQTVGKAIKNISDFQQANANLATIMQVSRREIETLTNDALMLGRTTEWTASQVTELQTALAKLGYNIPQIQNMQASVLQFATAVSANLPDAANMAGAALRMFGMHSTETQKALEILTASTNKTALDFEKLKTSLPYVGAIAHSIGFDIADTAALLGVLANSGLAASRTGTSLRQILLELSKQNGKLQTAMGGNIRTFDDFVNGLQGLRDRGLEAGEATKLVSTRASSALLILANGVDDIRRLNEEVRDTDGLLKEIQAERLDTLHGSTLLLKSAWEGLIQTFRDSAGPMKDIVDWLTKIIRTTSLAASRANRVAQGTKDVIGSDALIKQFEEQYDSLIKSGKTPEVAEEIVRKAMTDWYDKAFADNKNPGVEDKWWYKAFTNFTPATKWITRGVTRKSRAADEQVEAVSNAMDAVYDYMNSRAKEEAEITANNYLEEWKMVFDTQGEAAARAAMSSVAGHENIKSQVEAYIANGGTEGATERGKSSQDAAEQRRLAFIRDLKDEATYLRRLADAYAQLEPFLGNSTNAKMVELFGAGDYSKESIEKQIADIVAVLRGQGKEGADAADSIEQAWGLDLFSKALKQLKSDKKAADDAQESLQKYLDTMQDWADKNQDVSGTGAAYNVSKAIGTYNKSIAEANKTAKTAVAAMLGGTANPSEQLAGYANINSQWIRAKANALTTLRNDLTKYADDIMKEQLEGYDLTDWNDKTLSQINAIKDAIRGVEIPDDIKELILGMEGGQQLLAALTAEIERLKQAKIDKTVDPERWKKIAKQAKYIAERFLAVSDALKEFADASGNTSLSNAAEAVSRISQNVKAAEEGYKAFGGWWGAIIGGGSDLIEQVLGAFTETEEQANALKDTLRSISTDTAIKQFANDIKDAGESIWGENALGQMQEAIRKLKEVEAEISKITGIMQGGSVRPSVLSAQGAYTGVEFTRTKETLFKLADMWSLERISAETGLKILDEYGNFNVELLNWVKDAGWDLTEAEKDWIDEAIKTSTNYAEAMKVVEQTAESIVNGVVSDVADKIVDSWWEAGRAALDYADILEDVAKGYAKLIVQDMLMDAAFDGDRKQAFINALKSGDAQTAMATVAEAMRAAEDMLPAVEQALQVFEPYRTMGGGESNSVGSGIKSITEETANLLASYINAIRADVSYMRTMQEKGWGDVALLGASMPTLNDYLNQVAANTYDTAQNTQRILGELQSVIGAPGTSGSVVRVESYR